MIFNLTHFKKRKNTQLLREQSIKLIFSFNSLFHYISTFLLHVFFSVSMFCFYHLFSHFFLFYYNYSYCVFGFCLVYGYMCVSDLVSVCLFRFFLLFVYKFFSRVSRFFSVVYVRKCMYVLCFILKPLFSDVVVVVFKFILL